MVSYVVDGGPVETFEDDSADPSSYAVAGASLETDGIEILTVGQRGDPLKVDIAREGDTVEFRWINEHFEDRGGMSCTKA